MKLYHVTTPKKVKSYRATGRINPPVRGFDTCPAAMMWAMKTGRTVILEIEAMEAVKLPDHHNQFGNAYYTEHGVYNWEGVVHVDKNKDVTP